MTDLTRTVSQVRADAYVARHQFIPDLTWPKAPHCGQLHRDFDAMPLRRLLNEPLMQLAKANSADGSASGSSSCSMRTASKRRLTLGGSANCTRRRCVPSSSGHDR
jgi:hypothetical protein